MKKRFLFVALMCATIILPMRAQMQMRLWSAGQTISMPISTVDSITFAEVEEARVVLSTSKLELTSGEWIGASLTPVSPWRPDIEWTVEDPSIAAIGEIETFDDGESWCYLYGIKVGTTKLIASAHGHTSDTCIVKVSEDGDPYNPFKVKGSHIWPIILDGLTFDANQVKVVADFRPNDVDQFLYVWENTYSAGDGTGKNFYGNTEGYISLVCGNMGWSGCGFCLTTDTYAAQAEALRQAIVEDPDSYFLHIGIKATTQGNHQFYTFNDAATSFNIGTAAVEKGPVVGNFTRDGSWAEFDIPMAQFAAALANTFPTGGNILCALSGNNPGSQLNLDAVYFYKQTGAPQEPNPVTALTLSPSELTLVLGDDPVRLSYTTTPAGAEVTLLWASSNEEVATVSEKGVVTPISKGEAIITATVKGTEVKGTCKITVSSLEDQLAFKEVYLGRTAESEETYTFVHPSLGEIVAHVTLGRVQLFTEGLYFNASGQLDGAEQGGYIYMETPLAVAYADENPNNPNMAQFPNGVSFSLGDFVIATPESYELKEYTMIDYNDTEIKVELPVSAETGAPLTQVILPSKVNNEVFMGYMQAWMTDFNEKGDFTQENYQNFALAGKYGFDGPTLNLLQYAVNEEGKGEYEAYPNWLWDYTPNGIVLGGELYIGGDRGSSQYMKLIDYLNLDIQFVATDTCGIPGVYATIDPEKGYTITSTGVELGAIKNYTNGTKPQNKPARQHKGLNIFVDHALTMENAPALPAREAKEIRAFKNMPIKK